MRHLWFQLSLAFSLVVVLTIVLLVVFAMMFFRSRNANDSVTADLQTPGGLIDQLSDYYAQNHSWNEVEAYLFQRFSNPVVGSNRSFALSLVDLDGRIRAGFHTNQTVSTNDLKESVPVMVNAQTEGYILLTRIDTRPEAFQPVVLFQRMLVLILSVSVLGGLFSIIVATSVGRKLTAPLNHLVSAAHAIGEHDFSQRVKVECTVETQALAEAFNEMSAQLDALNRW